MSDEEKSYDVVIDTLQKQRDKLREMTERNMQSEYLGFNVMDEIRLKQIYTLNHAIEFWKKYKLQEALAHPQQKPIAWMNDREELYFDKEDASCNSDGFIQPLYTAPPKWVGLTDEQIFEHEWWHEETAFAVNKELKEMNSG